MTKAELKYGIRAIQNDGVSIENVMVDCLIDDLLRYDDRMDVRVVGDIEEDVTIDEYLRHIGIEPTEEEVTE